MMGFSLSCKRKSKEVEVHLRNNTVSSIPDSVFGKESLTILDIGCEGYTLYPSLSSIGTGYVEIPLAELPERIGEMKNLKILRIQCSGISKLPESLPKLTNLEELDISLNKNLDVLNEIGKIRQLPNLKILNIYDTRIARDKIELLKSLLDRKIKVIASQSEFDKFSN